MAILGVTSQSGRLFCPDDPGLDLRLQLSHALARIAPDAPIVIMIHGYRYHPGFSQFNPHDLLFSRSPIRACHKVTSWPQGLGFEPMTREDGLAIGFGWEGLPSRKITPKPRLSSFAHVYKQAHRAGGHLARLLTWIDELAPGRKVDILAHSLGARVTFGGLMRSCSANVERVVLMGGAEYASVIDQYFRHVDHHPNLEVFCVKNRQNGFVDFLFESFAPRSHPKDFVIGRGYEGPQHRWLNLAIDDKNVLAALADRGIGIGARSNRMVVDHWGFYNRAGIMRFYQNLFRNRKNWRLSDLRRELALKAMPGTDEFIGPKLLTP